MRGDTGYIHGALSSEDLRRAVEREEIARVEGERQARQEINTGKAVQADPVFGERVGVGSYGKAVDENGRPPYDGQQEVRDRVRISDALSGLENTLHSLGDAVEELEKLLGPILRPAVPIPSAEGKNPYPTESEVGAQIYTSSGRVSNKTQRIRELIERIDL